MQYHFLTTKKSPDLFWKSGAVISDSENNQAIIELRGTNTIVVTVAGINNPECLLRSIVRIFNETLENWYSGNFIIFFNCYL